MNQGLISIIIPTYNRKELLLRSINSVLSQTYPVYEIIIVDDGSTDGTAEVIKDKYSNHSKIKYFFKENEGMPAISRNYGISHARGEYLAFLDCDDYWYPNKLESQFDFLQKNPQYALVASSARGYLNNHEIVLGNYSWMKKSGFVFHWLLLRNFIVTSSVMVRSNILNEIGPFKMIKISEDYDLWLRISFHHKIKFQEKILVYYNMHDSNISGNILNNLDYADRVIKENLTRSSMPIFFKKVIYSITPFKKFLRLRAQPKEAMAQLDQAISINKYFFPYRIIKFLYQFSYFK